MESNEFLDIGRHCSEDSCRQLDFLPFSCPSCHLPFCQEHWRPPSGHKCTSYDPLLADNRIPSCQLCSTPISFPPGTDPNGPMDAHLSFACPVLHPHLASSSARAKSVNECAAPRCRDKMVVPIQCNACRGKFCPKHRFASDHACKGRAGAAQTNGKSAGAAAPQKGGMKKAFGGLLSSSSKTSSSSPSSAASSSRTPVAAAPAPRTNPLPSLAGLAALRRAQQARKPSSTAPVGTSANPLVLDSSSSDDSDVQVLPVRKPAASAGPGLGGGEKKVLAATGVRGAGSKRAAQEAESARKALEMRAKKGLLTEEEKVKYATMQALQAKKGGGKAGGEDGCVLC
ncbi:hypothetical protein JCM10450v2_007735 [Rhodotorula kratochvilovae]